MLLRAEPIGHPPSRRWIIQDIKKKTVWDGEKFVEDWENGRLYAHPSDACSDMADILKEFYSGLGPKRTLVVPIEIEVYGSAKPSKIARYLYQAAVLNMRTHDYGNGPGECLVLPTIHWGKIREINESALETDVDFDLGLEGSDEDE
ncbi:hypothetical protein LF1_35820 [Rubripirellula obstinata]|uniref:Uncharacterized protein n=1 Tax=Rubripirellula obstinata TaxID=406547 RepID=A0A5B1CIW6_9BACT|nr:hypothetical protein [Rubripirellula obstinata]KAA1261038.1 hypothetical protein LF1_35820 [Rubripirellula obstinata]